MCDVRLKAIILISGHSFKNHTFLKRRPIGRMKRSNLTGLRVKFSPTNVTFVTMRFQPFRRDLPVCTTLNASASDTARTLGIGTSYLP